MEKIKKRKKKENKKKLIKPSTNFFCFFPFPFPFSFSFFFFAVVIAGFTGYTYFFAFGGIQMGPLVGMWSCAAFMFVLSIRGLSRASSSLSRASGGDLVYFFFMFLTFIGVLVCSGFCIVYSEQGTFIIRDNWLKIKVGILLPFTSEYDLQETETINLQSTAGFGFGSSIIVLFGILHFTKRLGPGQNLILMVQALNFVLFCLGCFNNQL